jgi:hypothetical protein
LNGRSLGGVRLGEARASARAAFKHFRVWTHQTYDLFCFAGGPGLRIAYPSNQLLRHLNNAERRRASGRAILLLTANGHYSLGGMHPGIRLSAAARRLHLGKGFKVGFNTWYLIPGKFATGVLKVQRGVVAEIGIADKLFTSSRSAARRFLTSLW